MATSSLTHMNSNRRLPEASASSNLKYRGIAKVARDLETIASVRQRQSKAPNGAGSDETLCMPPSEGEACLSPGPEQSNSRSCSVGSSDGGQPRPSLNASSIPQLFRMSG